jgi:hypothetical protein
MIRGGAILILVLGTLAGEGCRRRTMYSQDRPDDVLKSARAMVRNGEANKLPDLILADDVYMRAFLRRVGSLALHMQELSSELARAFPNDVEKIRGEAQARALVASKNGSASGISGIIAQVASGTRTGTRAERERTLEGVIKELFADPYGWLEHHGDRLSTTELTDDMVAVLWDGEPILPPLGVAMKQHEGKWYVLLPVNVPMLKKYLPSTKGEWNMFASLVKVFDNAIIELRDDVRGTGTSKVASFADVSRKAGEKIFMPAALAFVAIGKHYENKFRKPAAPSSPTVPTVPTR